jgi:anaphase-promoting complex subunit 3
LPDSAAMYCMLGKLWQSVGDSKKAVDSYVSAVKINPFLWEAFTGLCDTGRLLRGPALKQNVVLTLEPGVNLRVNNIFKQSAEMMESVKTAAPSDENAAKPRASAENHNDPFMTTTQNRDRSDLQYSNHPSFLNRLNEGVIGGSSVPPQLETPTAQSSSNSSTHDLMGNTNAFPEKPPAVRKTRAAADVGVRKLSSRSTRDHNAELKRPNLSEPTVPAAPARRSTRLNTLKFASKIGGSDRESKLSTEDPQKT